MPARPEIISIKTLGAGTVATGLKE